MYQTHDHMEDYDSAQGDVGSRGATINSKSTRRSHPVNRIERIQQNRPNQQNNNDDLAASIRRGQQNARRNPRHHHQQEEDVETQLSPDELMARIMGHGRDDDDDDGFSVNTGRLGGGATTVAGDELTFDGSTIATNPHQHHHLPYRHQHHQMGGMQMPMSMHNPSSINRTPSGIDLEWNRQGNNTGHHHAPSLYPPKMEGTDGTDSSEDSPPYSRKSSQSSKRKKGTCCGVSKCCLIVVLLLLLAAVGAGAGWLFLIYLPGQDNSSGAQSSSTASMSYPCCTGYNQDNWSSKQVCTEDGCCSVCPAADSTTAAIDTLEKPKPEKSDSEDAPQTEPPVKATVAPITVTDAPIPATDPPTAPPVPEQEKETPRPTTAPVTPQPTQAPTPFPTLAPVTPVPTPEPTDPPRVAATIPPVTPAPTAGATTNGTVL